MREVAEAVGTKVAREAAARAVMVVTAVAMEVAADAAAAAATKAGGAGIRAASPASSIRDQSIRGSVSS